jgi:hypothetical protein
MQAHVWGLKTFYYSLINKAGSKMQEDQLAVQVNGHTNSVNGYEIEEDCEACKL